jgi:hypothetical protein
VVAPAPAAAAVAVAIIISIPTVIQVEPLMAVDGLDPTATGIHANEVATATEAAAVATATPPFGSANWRDVMPLSPPRVINIQMATAASRYRIGHTTLNTHPGGVVLARLSHHGTSLMGREAAEDANPPA